MLTKLVGFRNATLVTVAGSLMALTLACGNDQAEAAAQAASSAEQAQGGSSSTPLIITPGAGALAQGILGKAYGQALSTTGGGNRPVTWSIVSGSLPAGLSIIANWGNSSTMITGTPTQAQTSSFTVKAKDQSGNSATMSYTITVLATAPPTPLTIYLPWGVLPTATVGVNYVSTIGVAGGGVRPITWSVVAGSLPAGMTSTVNSTNDFVIRGVATTAQTAAFTVEARDQSGNVARLATTLTVH